MALTQLIKMLGDTAEFNKTVAKSADATRKAFTSVSNEISKKLGDASKGAAKGAKKEFSELASEVKSAVGIDALMGAGALATIAIFTKKAHDMASSVSDLADSLNISVEDTQRLGVAAGLTGTKIDKLHGAIAAVNDLRAAAFQFDPEAMRKFQILGIDPKKSVMEIVHAMAIATGQASIVVDNIFGRSAKRIKETLNTMKTMGPIDAQKQEQIDAIKQFDNSIAELYRTLVVHFTPIIVGLNTMLQNFLEGLRVLTDFGASWFVTGKAPQIGNDKLMKAYNNAVSLGTASLFYEDQRIAKTSPVVNKPENPPAAMPRYAPVGGADAAFKGDALTRIGLFVGGAPNIGDRLVTIGGYQLTQLRLIRSELEKLNQ